MGLLGTMDLSWVDAIAQLATAGGFAALVWYLVIRHIPAIEERHREERGEWKRELLEFIKSRDESLQTFLRERDAKIGEIVQHVESLLNDRRRD